MVLEDVLSFVRQKGGKGLLRSFLLERVEKTKELLDDGCWIPCLDLSNLILSGLNNKNRGGSRLLAVVGAFVYLGADILDDIHDNELVTSYPRANATLVAATLLTVFPTLAIAGLSVLPELRFKLQETVAKSLLKMSNGQQKDIFFTNQEDISLARIKESIQAKSGEEAALCSLMAAQYAGVSLSQQRLFEDFGRFLGTALQIVSDYYDVLWSEDANDLKRGAPILPVVFCMKRLKDEARDNFVTLLKRFSSGQDLLKPLRQIMVKSGAFDYSAVVVEDLCQKSLGILEQLELSDDVKTLLKNKIQSASLLQTKPKGENYEYADSNHQAV